MVCFGRFLYFQLWISKLKIRQALIRDEIDFVFLNFNIHVWQKRGGLKSNRLNRKSGFHSPVLASSSRFHSMVNRIQIPNGKLLFANWNITYADLHSANLLTRKLFFLVRQYLYQNLSGFFSGMLIANARKMLDHLSIGICGIKIFAPFFAQKNRRNKRWKIFTHIDDFHLTNYKYILYFQKFRFLTSKKRILYKKFLWAIFYMYKLF